MSTTITYPPMTRDELEDVRWLACEAVARAVNLVGGHSPDGLEEVALVVERAWALGSIGLEFEEPTPGLEGAPDEDDRWPGGLRLRHCRTILAAADDLEELYLSAVDDVGGREAGVAFWMPRIERVRRARAVLERGLDAASALDG